MLVSGMPTVLIEVNRDLEGHTIDLRKLPKIVFRPLGQHRADGLAWTDQTLEVDCRMENRDRLETIIHEAMHMALPWLPEKFILRAALYIAKVLWHMEYRADEGEQDARYLSRKD